MEQLTFWSEERPARASASREEEAVSKTAEAASRSRLLDFLRLCALDGSSGKTFPAAFRPLEELTSEGSSGPLSTSGMACAGGFLTFSTQEYPGSLAPFPSGDGVSSLSDILVPAGSVRLKYYLSRTACRGILRRAEARGKKIPEVLRKALESQASRKQ